MVSVRQAERDRLRNKLQDGHGRRRVRHVFTNLRVTEASSAESNYGAA